MIHVLLAASGLATSSGRAGGGLLFFFILFVCGVIGYVIPGIIASLRQHRNSVAIWALTILAGWTFLGWLIAFIWSLTNPTPPQQIIVNTTNPKA
jgi:Superinfection immunity protein